MADEYSSDRRVEGELGLNSCGAQTLFDRDYQIRRTRSDCTLMYVAKGRATMTVGRQRITVEEGEAMFYPAERPQDYTFLARDNSINKWVHFGGYLASKLERGGARKIAVTARREFENALDRLIGAYNGVGAEREALMNGYLRVVIALLSESESGGGGADAKFSHRMTDALNYIHINAFSGVDFDRAASLCYLSRDRFNHVFRKITGFPPNVYLTKIRIERAKLLLTDVGMTVGECAESVGYRDVNYFCRVFKKETGVSPKKYVPR